jgi:5,10-methylenetetrahydromethanopterin reductase
VVEATVARFGLNLGVSPREPIGRIGDIAQAAERHGFEAVWVLDSQLAMKDVYVALTIAAQATSRILLGTGVTNPVTRHITHTANAIGAVDEVSAGRALLGLGSGDSAVFPLGGKPASVAEMRCAVDDLRALLAGREITLSGQKVRVLTIRRPMPIFLGASQPRLLTLAGEVADGVILLGGADLELTAWQLDWIERGARRAGRVLADVFVDLWLPISLGDDEDRAREDVKAVAASQARWFHRWTARPPVLERFRDEFLRASDAYEFRDHLSLHAKHRETVSDEFTDFVALAGDADKCAGRIRRLLALKVDRISFTLLSGGRLERIANLGTRLLPRLAGGAS